MSTNTFKALIESVDNGLQIAQFVQENREILQKEIRDSAIADTEARTNQETSSTTLPNSSAEQNGSDIRGSALQGTEGNGGHRYNLRLGQDFRVETISNNSVGGSTGDRDNQNGDAPDHNDEDQRNRNGSEWDNNSNVRGGDSELSGDDEFERGSAVHSEGLLSFEGLDDNDGTDTESTGVKRSMNIRDADSIDESILDDIFNEGDTANEKRLKSSSRIQELSGARDLSLDPIKKGIEEKSQLMSSVEKQLFVNGATQSVHQSDLSPSKISVTAGDAQSSATTVNMMITNSQDKNIENINQKLDSLLLNQQTILEKLNSLGEIKEELIGVKKTLNNFGLTLSTIEGYINSLLIIIPKQGVSRADQGKEINPDLKMVVGRDQRRGLIDEGVLSGKQVATKFGEDIFDVDSFNTEMFLEPIKHDKNHAAKFIPGNNPTSIKIIKEILKQRVKDSSIYKSLVEFVDQSASKVSAETIHKEILSMLDSVGL